MTGLNIVREAILEVLKELDIDEMEKLELMINLSKFLAPDEYEENIGVLRRKEEVN